MTNRTTIFSKTYGEDHYEVFRVTFDGVREAKGFNRAVTTSRHEYRINGRRIAKDVWMAMKSVAKDAA